MKVATPLKYCVLLNMGPFINISKDTAAVQLRSLGTYYASQNLIFEKWLKSCRKPAKQVMKLEIVALGSYVGRAWESLILERKSRRSH
jgi:hypothetical protein